MRQFPNYFDIATTIGMVLWVGGERAASVNDWWTGMPAVYAAVWELQYAEPVLPHPFSDIVTRLTWNPRWEYRGPEPRYTGIEVERLGDDHDSRCAALFLAAFRESMPCRVQKAVEDFHRHATREPQPTDIELLEEELI